MRFKNWFFESIGEFSFIQKADGSIHVYRNNPREFIGRANDMEEAQALTQDNPAYAGARQSGDIYQRPANSVSIAGRTWGQRI